MLKPGQKFMFRNCFGSYTFGVIVCGYDTGCSDPVYHTKATPRSRKMSGMVQESRVTLLSDKEFDLLRKSN
jgi:hypothetical protein